MALQCTCDFKVTSLSRHASEQRYKCGDTKQFSPHIFSFSREQRQDFCHIILINSGPIVYSDTG